MRMNTSFSPSLFASASCFFCRSAIFMFIIILSCTKTNALHATNKSSTINLLHHFDKVYDEKSCAYFHPQIEYQLDSDDTDHKEWLELRQVFQKLSELLPGKSQSRINVHEMAGKEIFLYSSFSGTTSSETVSLLWNATHYVKSGGQWTEPRTEFLNENCESKQNQDGSFILFKGFMPDHNTHVLLDIFPTIFMIFRLLSSNAIKLEGKILLPKTSIIHEHVGWWAKSLSNEPETWIQKHFAFYEPMEVNCFSNSKISVLTYEGLMEGLEPRDLAHSPIVTLPAREYFDATMVQQKSCEENERKIIYYSPVAHGQDHSKMVMNENEVLEVIQGKMIQNSRPEKLVVFDGDEKMSLSERYDLFRCASTIVGLHGTGMANLMWTPMSKDCINPVHVVEFTCGHRAGCPSISTYFTLLGGFPWGRYHSLLLQKSSNAQQFSVPIDTLSELLDRVWNKHYSGHTTLYIE